MQQKTSSHSSVVSRRQVIQRGAATVLAGALPRPTWGMRTATDSSSHSLTARTIAHARLLDPESVRTLALQAIDAARDAGARYADVRLVRTVKQRFVGPMVRDSEEFTVGIRALVNGVWGFAASPYWTKDEMARLAHEAVAQAQVNASASPHPIELCHIPIATGSWTMPGIDPFSISIEEKIDFLGGWTQSVSDAERSGLNVYNVECKMSTARQERYSASTEGSVFTQIVYQTGGEFTLRLMGDSWRDSGRAIPVKANNLYLQGKGWDVFLDAKLDAQIPSLVAQVLELRALRAKSVEPGRYTIVLDAETAASVMDQTFGVATQLDRALGYEANAGGTSYLGPDPMVYLGTNVGVPLLTVTGDRTMPSGLATVKWDDEGVVSTSFPIVKDGVLVDYQTTREQASWLTDWYTRQQQPVSSHGCAAAPDASAIVMQHCPNLTLQPGAESLSFDDMIAATSRGIAFTGGSVRTDFQARTGNIFGQAREIVNGKLGPVLVSASVSFSATELWKSIMALGGTASTSCIAAGGVKGQPRQGTVHTVAAVPMVIREMTVIDQTRRS